MIGSFIITTYCSGITSHAEFFGKTLNHLGDLTPLQPRFGILWLLAFSKTKITFESEEISDQQWYSGKYDGAADGNWENCVRFQGTYFEGDWGIIVLCTMFLTSRIFFNKCLYFSYYMAAYLLDRPYIYTKLGTGVSSFLYVVGFSWLVFIQRFFCLYSLEILTYHFLWYLLVWFGIRIVLSS